MTDSQPGPEPFVRSATEILEEARARGLVLRLTGGIALHLRCAAFSRIQAQLPRRYDNVDLDFVAYSKQMRDVERLFADAGFIEDKRIKSVPGLRRSIFHSPDQAWHCDIFYDVLEFSHEIDIRGRLELDFPTVTLADLLLGKMQIAEINEKDVVDTIMLLRAHDVSESDDSAINAAHVARLSKADWGLWRTLTGNLATVGKLAETYGTLTGEDRDIVEERRTTLLQRVEEEPPTLRWRLRSRVGDRVKWYRDVDEVI